MQYEHIQLLDDILTQRGSHKKKEKKGGKQGSPSFAKRGAAHLCAGAAPSPKRPALGPCKIQAHVPWASLCQPRGANSQKPGLVILGLGGHCKIPAGPFFFKPQFAPFDATIIFRLPPKYSTPHKAHGVNKMTSNYVGWGLVAGLPFLARLIDRRFSHLALLRCRARLRHYPLYLHPLRCHTAPVYRGVFRG